MRRAAGLNTLLFRREALPALGEFLPVLALVVVVVVALPALLALPALPLALAALLEGVCFVEEALAFRLVALIAVPCAAGLSAL